VCEPDKRNAPAPEQRTVYTSGELSASQVCDANNPDATILTIDPSRVLRQGVSPNLFGFTVDWFQFQHGHFRNGTVRPETIAWLNPFAGALYRYSGGNAFEWKNAVGPIAQRKVIYANFQGMAHPEFGPSEFFDFLRGVRGSAVILLNIVGPRNLPSKQSAMLQDNLDYIAWLSRNGANCVAGDRCPISEFELGNEVDWDPFMWGAMDYVARVLPLVTTAKSAYPGIKFAAMGKTAPWDATTALGAKLFDATVAEQLGREVDSVTIHPYYDGLSIPEMQTYIQDLKKKYRVYNPNVRVLVTEHGRWPDVPETGEWSVNWYQASGSGGALSAADFILMLMNDSGISGAMWHTISVTGPWQLFHMNQTNDSVYPSAVYWSLRTLRAGLLTDSVEVSPSLVPGGVYGGGYDFRSVAMKDDAGSYSLMGVNRGIRPKAISVRVGGVQLSGAVTEFNVLQGDDVGSDNTDAQPNRFEMTSSLSVVNSVGESSYCIPPKSIFSIVVRPKN